MIIGQSKLADTDEPGYGQAAIEKKAVRASIQAIEAALDRARAAAENPGLLVDFDWEAYGAFVDALATETDRAKPNLYGLAGELASEGLASLAEACSDPDFKRAAKSLRTWKITPVCEARSSSNAQTYAREGDTMRVSMHPCVSTGGASLDGVRGAL